jgi:hypothetical protein
MRSLIPRKNPIKHGGERGIRTPINCPVLLGETDPHTEKHTELSVLHSQDLSKVVQAWANLPVALKAAILAIVESSAQKEARP